MYLILWCSSYSISQPQKLLQVAVNKVAANKKVAASKKLLFLIRKNTTSDKTATTFVSEDHLGTIFIDQISVQKAKFSTTSSSEGKDKIPTGPGWNGVKRRLDLTGLQEESRKQLHDINEPDVFQRNIENYIGTVKVPVGLVKVKVNGQHAQGVYHVPMATTEAALVASYNRGMFLKAWAN